MREDAFMAAVVNSFGAIFVPESSASFVAARPFGVTMDLSHVAEVDVTLRIAVLIVRLLRTRLLALLASWHCCVYRILPNLPALPFPGLL